MSKKILAFVMALVLVCSLVPAVAAAETSATISFAEKTNRTVYTTEQQVWAQNGITVTNDKGASTSNVGDFADPGRFYKSSTVTIAYPGMTSIVIDCNGSKTIDVKYITAWATTLDTQGVAYTNESKVITITLDAPVDSFTFETLAAQARAYSITVYTGEGAPVIPEDTTPTESQPPFVAPTTPEEIVNAAYGLASGETLEGTYTLTGEITAIDTAYSSQYKNVSVKIVVGDMTDKPILCFRMKGDGADIIGVGDTITVTGALKNYNGTIEFDAGCTLDSYTEGSAPEENLTTFEEIVNAAYELEVGESLQKTYTLTGVISVVDTPYDSQYKNITVQIIVAGMTDKPITCYRLKGEGADQIDVGDVISVTGTIKNYNGTVEFVSGCTLDDWADGETNPTDPEPTDPEPTEPTPTDPVPGEGAPVAGVPYKFGMIQEKVSTSDIYYLAGGMSGYYMASTTDAEAAIDVYLEETTGGYYLYTMDAAGTVTYINMVISADGQHVNGAYEATASTVYTYDAEMGTIVTSIKDGVYRFGTRNDKTYTTVGPVDVSKGNFYCKFYEVGGSGDGLVGDITGDGAVNNDDVVYLLWHTLFADEYPLTADGDITGDGSINNDDVVYLLWHTLFPTEYPL